MELSSHVTANLDQWVENGFINAAQREAVAQLMEGAFIDVYDNGYDHGFDHGWTEGHNEGFREAADASFEEGYSAAITEHGIEE